MPPPLAGISGGDNKTQGGGGGRRERWGRPWRNIRGAALIMLRATLIVLSYALALLILSLTTSLILLVVSGMTWAIALGFCFGFEMAAAHRVLIHKLRKIRVMYDELKEYTLGIFMFLIVILSALALDVVLGVIFCMKIWAIYTWLYHIMQRHTI